MPCPRPIGGSLSSRAFGRLSSATTRTQKGILNDEAGDLYLPLYPLGWRALTALPVFLLAGTFSASAQTRGDTDEVTHDVLFASDRTLQFDLDPNVGRPVRQQLTLPLRCNTTEAGLCRKTLPKIGKGLVEDLIEDLFGVNIPGEVLDVLDILDVNPLTISLRATADLSGYFQVSGTTDGTVAVSDASNSRISVSSFSMSASISASGLGGV